MLTGNGIKLFDLHFLRHVLFVFGGRIKMASSGGRLQFDFFTHDMYSLEERGTRLNSLALSAQIGEHRIDTFFIDSAQSGIGQP